MSVVYALFIGAVAGLVGFAVGVGYERGDFK